MLLSITPEMLEAIASILWPVIVLIALLILGPHIYRIIKQATDVTVEIGEYKFTVSSYTAEILIKPIKDELNEAVARLTDEQKKIFWTIYKTVESGEKYFVPNDFVRDSPIHQNYRTLRDVNFIRPNQGGRWEPGVEVQIKNLGRLAAKMKKQDLAF